VLSLLLTLAVAAGPEPQAPVAPEPPRFELPDLPPLIAGRTPSAGQPSTPTPSATPTPTPTPTPTSNATATPIRAANATPPRSRNPRPAHAPPDSATAKNGANPAPPRAQACAPEATVPPPSLTASALRDELRASSQRRQEELAAIARERARLEKLSEDIAAARLALEAETARLDEKVKKAEAAKGTSNPQAQGALSRPAGKPPSIALAKTLKGMKPEQAAVLVSRLDHRLAVELLQQMRPADAGGVLEKMKPETAAELFSLMASSEAGGTR
jgi:flagellar motility protein MotE (MotC chaperone)